MSKTPDPNSFCDELPATRKKQITLDTIVVDATNGKDCTLILRIGKSDFVEITGGKIRPACLPSSHK